MTDDRQDPEREQQRTGWQQPYPPPYPPVHPAPRHPSPQHPSGQGLAAWPGQHAPPGHLLPPPPRQHPRATTALVLGLVSVVGSFVLVLIPSVLAPLAWWNASRALREIDDEPDVWSGRESARAGRVLGIIGTLLLTVAAAAAWQIAGVLPQLRG